jgi:DDE superfamily endonuclease
VSPRRWLGISPANWCILSDAPRGPAGSLAGLSGEKAFRRGHGALYDALACGDIGQEVLGGLLARSWEVADEGPLKIAVDVSPWPRPDAETSEGRCHAYAACRCDGARKTIPGWPYSFAAGLEWGATSWTALPGAVRIGPLDSASTVTAAQAGRVHRRLAAAGLLAGRPAAVFVFDSGYDLTRIAYLTSHGGVPAQVLGRVRSDRVFYGPAPRRTYHRQGGAPRRHGARFALAKPAGLPVPASKPRPAAPATGGCGSAPGTNCTSSCPATRAGAGTPASCPSSPAQ